MQYRELTIGGHRVPFYYGHGCLDEMCDRLSALEADRFVIVTDDGVRGLFGDALAARLERVAPCLILSEAAGEANKNLNTLLSHAERALEWGMTRRSVLLALGGGVPGNLGGLLAALLFRGVRLVHVPTTLISMLDSVISLKQAVNSRFGKNLLGTFYCPAAILADTSTLETLPQREVRAGFCEIIKNALAIHPHTIDPLSELLRPDCRLDADISQRLLELSLSAKLEVMAADACEKGRGLILEYGHTTGHAIELASQAGGGEGVSHGEAVGIGMIAAANIARRMGGLDEGEVELHYKLLSCAGIRPRLPPQVTPEKVLHLIRYDNKRGYQQGTSGRIDMILLRRLGEPFGRPELPLTPVPVSYIEQAVESLAHGASAGPAPGL